MEPGYFDAVTHPFARAAKKLTGKMVEAAPVPAAAEKQRKGKGAKGDVNRRCKQQAADWGILVDFSCGENAECQDQFLPCADPLAICDFDTFLVCLIGPPPA